MATVAVLPPPAISPLVIRGRRVDPDRRASRGLEGRAPRQAASRSTREPGLQGARPTGRSLAGRVTSTAIAQNPRRRQESPRPQRSARETNGKAPAKQEPPQ